ncbi:MAG: hypothetical protein AABX03_02055 [Nanoarchaeota archaeon]
MRVKFIFLALALLILTSGVYANSLGLSRANLEFVGDIGEEVCKELIIFSGESVSVSGEDRWSLKNSKELSDYTKYADELKIDINYPESVNFNKKETVNVCITGNENGKYHGVLIYKDPEIAGVGTWLEVTVGNGINPNSDEGEKETIKSSSVSLTGSSVDDTSSGVSGLYIVLFFSFILLIVVLIVLFVLYRKSKRTRVI